MDKNPDCAVCEELGRRCHSCQTFGDQDDSRIYPSEENKCTCGHEEKFHPGAFSACMLEIGNDFCPCGLFRPEKKQKEEKDFSEDDNEMKGQDLGSEEIRNNG